MLLGIEWIKLLLDSSHEQPGVFNRSMHLLFLNGLAGVVRDQPYTLHLIEPLAQLAG
jgi:hypothetical protein